MLCDCHVYPTVAAKDLNRARQFYEQVLGFKAAYEDPGGILYDALGSRFLLYPTMFAGTNEATYMAFETDDLARMVGDLRSKGVRFQEYDLPDFKTKNGVAEMPDGGKGAWFLDPESNIIALFQPTQKLAWPREMVAAGGNR